MLCKYYSSIYHLDSISYHSYSNSLAPSEDAHQVRLNCISKHLNGANAYCSFFRVNISLIVISVAIGFLDSLALLVSHDNVGTI